MSELKQMTAYQTGAYLKALGDLMMKYGGTTQEMAISLYEGDLRAGYERRMGEAGIPFPEARGIAKAMAATALGKQDDRPAPDYLDCTQRAY